MATPLPALDAPRTLGWGMSRGLRSAAPIQPMRHRGDSKVAGNPFRIAFLALFGLLLAFAGSARWLGWGRDFGEYYVSYDTVTPYFGWGNSRFEAGYEMTAFIFVNYFNAPFPTFYFFMILFALTLKFALFWRYSGSPVMAAIAYALLLYPMHEYTQVRAAVALALAYWGIHLLLEDKVRWGLALIALAFTFHASILLLGAVAIGAYYIPLAFAAAGLLVVALAALAMYSQLSGLITTLFGSINPLVDRYVFNSEGNVGINILSGSNILYMVTSLAALASGWLQRDRYHSIFLIILLTSFLTLVVFRESPVLALRSSEMLNVAAIFLIFRQPLTPKTAPLQLLMLLNGAWTTYRSLVEGVLGG